MHGCRDIPKDANYPNFEKYVVNKLNSKLSLGFTINASDIDICHILPKSRDKSKNQEEKFRPDSNPIIIKFLKRSIRNAIFAKKKTLKAKNENETEKLYITESLTKRRIELLSNARNAFGIKNVWISNGNVFCIHQEKKHPIIYMNDIDKILQAHE